MKYIEPLFRPPAEADSLIFQVAYGCPHNRCRFCAMYKTVRYSQRSQNEILAEFADAAKEYPHTRRIFLADGDVMFLKYDYLRTMLEELNRLFPRLTRVNLYANGSSILKKTPGQLTELRNLKLHTLYVGLESGDEELLQKVNKGETADQMTEAVQMSQSADLRCSVMILLGLAGKEGSEKHAVQTAKVLNQMQPRLLSALRFIEVDMGKENRRIGNDDYCENNMFDGYIPLTEYEAVCELRKIIAGLELEKTVFRANHTSNPIPLEGRFPKDRASLLQLLDHQINSGMFDQAGPGFMPFPGML
jgi:radical SAM superfamily enzyme YgiQ (UPF0313 family)